MEGSGSRGNVAGEKGACTSFRFAITRKKVEEEEDSDGFISFLLFLLWWQALMEQSTYLPVTWLSGWE